MIYVGGTCGTKYSPFGPKPGYNEDSGCGNVYVHGEYKKSLTIAAQNDVVINESITTPVSGEKPTTNALLGLIANNFVRVYHPLTGVRPKGYSEGKCPTASNAPEDLKNPTIYAAILALKHSFIVDNFDCGKPELGPLKVYGAIAGLFTNGMTGVFSGATALTGYPYNLKYDNRLAGRRAAALPQPDRGGLVRPARDAGAHPVGSGPGARPGPRCGRRDSNPQGLTPTGS